MKKTSIILSAFIGLLAITACGNANNQNKDQNKAYSDSINQDGDPIYPDSVNQDSSTVNYRDSNSTVPSGTVPPTSN